MIRPLTWNPKESGIDENALRKYLDEQIYSLPGTDRHRDVFTVLLTGSRAMGKHTPESDVDIDVLCPEETYIPLQKACREAGITRSQESFWCPLSHLITVRIHHNCCQSYQSTAADRRYSPAMGRPTVRRRS